MTTPPTTAHGNAGMTQSSMQANFSFLQQEQQVANNCLEAWRAIQQFESLFSNIFPGAQIDQGYLARRAEYVELAKQNAESLDLPPGSAGDAVLILDRLVCQRPTLYDPVSTTLLCVHYISLHCVVSFLPAHAG